MPQLISASRRQFLKQAAAGVGVCLSWRTVIAKTRALLPDPLLELSASEAVAAMTRGDITAEKYATAMLNRCATLKFLNAFISLEPERVLEEARQCDRKRRLGVKLGPLHGLPIPIKDSINTTEYPTTGGTRSLKSFRPSADAPIVRTIRATGGIVLGKTNMHELSYGFSSNNRAFGTVHNPYDITRIPGGSSGGTAAAVAARIAPLGLGADTCGSIRVPAAMCGIVGLRPSTGRYSTEGVVPIAPLFDQVGPQARAVSDLSLFDSAITHDWSHPATPSLKGIRIGIVRSYWFAALDPEVERVTATAIMRLKEAGVVIVESDPSSLPDLARLIALSAAPIYKHDFRPALTDYLARYGAGVSFEQVIEQASPDVQEILKSDVLPGASGFITERQYREARGVHLPAVKRLFRAYFSQTGVAAIVFPATPIAASLIGQAKVEINGKQVFVDDALEHNIAPGSTAGLPCLVVPAGRTKKGLPVSLEFDAPERTDRKLLSLGRSIEKQLGQLPSPVIYPPDDV